MTLFEKLQPELTEEHQGLRRKGIALQREALQTLIVRYSGLISSAVKTEMVLTGCSYTEACEQLVRACDHFTANMYYLDMGEEAEKE